MHNLQWIRQGRMPVWLAATFAAVMTVIEMIDSHAILISLIATVFPASLLSRTISPPRYYSLAQGFIAREQTTAPPARH